MPSRSTPSTAIEPRAPSPTAESSPVGGEVFADRVEECLILVGGTGFPQPPQQVVTRGAVQGVDGVCGASALWSNSGTSGSWGLSPG
jgi:hypothetical protein